MATIGNPTVINNKKYIINARVPIVFFASCFESISEPNNANGTLGTPNNIITRKKRLSKEFDAAIPGNSIVNPNHSNFAIRDSKTSNEYKSIPIKAPAKGLERPNNFCSGAASLLSCCREESFMLVYYS